jgi:hypothetical protein
MERALPGDCLSAGVTHSESARTARTVFHQKQDVPHAHIHEECLTPTCRVTSGGTCTIQAYDQSRPETQTRILSLLTALPGCAMLSVAVDGSGSNRRRARCILANVFGSGSPSMPCST